MKRIVLWFMSTLTVVVLLFGYKTSTSASSPLTANSAALAPITVTSTAAAAASAPTTSSTTASTTTSSGTSNSTSSNLAASAPSTAAAAKKTVTGSVVQTRWGPVQVQLTVVGTKITAVDILQHPTGGRSDEINAAALPILISETLKAQNAQIDMISGATYTSDGYLQSLQSALDQAGI